MDEELVRRWNEVVELDDAVYHLGDFTLGSNAAKYTKQLNGHINFLGTWWHHDRRWLFSTIPMWSASGEEVNVMKSIYVGKFTVNQIVLCHYPFAIWDRKHHGAWHLHGHSHGRYKGDGFIYDVGVDNNDFYPVSIDEIRVVMEKKGWHPEWRQYG